jgi:putative endonuclease
MAGNDREPAPERIAAFKTGLSAESRAAAYLVAKGYRIMARRRGTIVFVEVKARASLDEAAYAVTPHQQARIVAAAEAWIAAHPQHAQSDFRFDAMLVAPGKLPRHLTAAFDASA